MPIYGYNIHNILKIESNIPLLDGAFHKYFLSDTPITNPDLVIKVVDSVKCPKGELKRHDLWFYGEEGGDCVYYVDRFFGKRDEMAIKGIGNATTEIEATKNVMRIPLRSRGSLSDLVECAVDLKFLEAGFFTIHAASLSQEGAAILLTGFPNIGKTLCTLHLLKKDFRYLGDDNGLINQEGEVYAYPTTSSIGYHDFLKYIHPKDIGRWKYYKHLFRVLPMRNKLIERIFHYPEIYLPDIEGFEQGKRARGNITCCLEIGQRKIEEVDIEEMTNKIWLSTFYSRPSIMQNPFLQVYAYFNGVEFSTIIKRQKEVIRGFLGKSKCYSISCREHDWDAVLDEILQKGGRT